MNWLQQIAPTIASALGGPLGGLAYEVISKVMGVSQEDVQDILSNGKLTSDQLAQIKLAEVELQKQAQDLGLDFEQLAEKDRESARTMQVSTKSRVPQTLAFFVTVGFFSTMIALMTDNVAKSDALLLMLGSLATSWTGIITFYFGSTSSSQRKDELLHQSNPVNGT